MKKLVALFLALVMTLSLCTVAFAEDATGTAITEVDLSNLPSLGTGWAGKKVEDVLPISIGNISNCTVARQRIMDNKPPYGPYDSKHVFATTDDCYYELVLKANEGFVFPYTYKDSVQQYDGSVSLRNGGTVPYGWMHVGSYNVGDGFNGGSGKGNQYLMVGISITVTEPTPINLVDLSSLKIGEGWAGLTKQQIESKVSGYSADNCKYNQFTILDSAGSTEVATSLLKGTDYILRLDLKANEGFAFPGSTSGTYNGTIKTNGEVILKVAGKYEEDNFYATLGAHSFIRIGIKFTATEAEDTSINWETLAKGAAIAAGITVVTVGTIHTVKAIKNYKAEKAAAAEAAKLAEMPMVAFGDSGDAVTTLQTELNAQGYNCGEVDGVFGQNTLNAVIAFQTANGLAADGIVGELTWGALL